jgi:two-component system, cell cycle sensor histidine kinase and response regulator CckA
MGALTGYDLGSTIDFPRTLDALFPRGEDRVLIGDMRLCALGAAGLPGKGETLLYGRNGTRRWVELSCQQPAGLQNGTGYLLFMAIDVSAARRAQQESSEWRRRSESFTAASGQVTYECSSQSATIALGGSVEQVLGYQPGDLDGSLEQWSAMIHPGDRARVDGLYDEALRDGSTFQAEYSFRHKSGRWVLIRDRGFPVPATAESPPRMIGTMQDIGALRELETALRESEERFRTLVQESSDVIAIYDVNGQFTYVSPSVERLYGYAPESLLGTSAFTLVHPDDRSLVQEAFLRAVSETQRSSPFTFRIRMSDGRWVRVETIARNLLHHPQIRGVVVTFRDVTERKAAEEKMARLQEQLLQAQKMEAIGRLAGGVAHDFNNLLTSIIGYADLLLREDRVSGDVREGIQEVETAAYRAADLTRRLLTFSRKQVLQTRVVDLNSLIVNLEKMLRRMIGEDVTLSSRLDPGIGSLRTDPGQIEQAIINLAVNARDAMPEGGTLGIDTENVILAPRGLPGHPEADAGRYVLVTVSDTGIGMSEEVRSHLFEPFFTTKEPGRGTGLGLATVYGIVRQSGGHIDITTAPGRGATFRIYLPCVDEQEAPDSDACADSAEQRGNETLMVVEDEQPLLKMIEKTLRACGYRTIGAGGAGEALQALDGEGGRRIDLLITDVVMPITGGLKLSKEICRRRPGTKVLFISGYTGEEFNEEHLYEPGTGFLAKPFSLKALAAKVRELLDA